MPDTIQVTDFNLAATLECGQAFRWQRAGDGWFTGVVGREVWRVRQEGQTLAYNCSREAPSRLSESTGDGRENVSRLQHYLALDVSWPDILASFPTDPHLRQAIQNHAGLRVLRQEPWETLASFIASSSKQIVQIRQIVAALARRFGEPIDETHFAFPSVAVIARASHQQLWDCKLGFRAKNLLAAARQISSGQCDLAGLPRMEFDRALEELDRLPGVGEKIALCTLLFSCGFDQAFPVDVWVERSLRRLYFPGKKVTTRQLRDFTRNYFGPYAGWAQQYLFFTERTRSRAAGGN